LSIDWGKTTSKNLKRRKNWELDSRSRGNSRQCFNPMATLTRKSHDLGAIFCVFCRCSVCFVLLFWGVISLKGFGQWFSEVLRSSFRQRNVFPDPFLLHFWQILLEISIGSEMVSSWSIQARQHRVSEVEIFSRRRWSRCRKFCRRFMALTRKWWGLSILEYILWAEPKCEKKVATPLFRRELAILLSVTRCSEWCSECVVSVLAVSIVVSLAVPSGGLKVSSRDPAVLQSVRVSFLPMQCIRDSDLMRMENSAVSFSNSFWSKFPGFQQVILRDFLWFRE